MASLGSRSKRRLILALAGLFIVLLGARWPGLTWKGYVELHQAGIDKYVGQFQPATSEPVFEWTKHTFDREGGDGPICIDGSEFNVYTRERDPERVMVFLNGGGACWQDFYNCSLQASVNPPSITGVFADSYDNGGPQPLVNPLADWSVMFVSYCDGSVFTGDNEFEDPNPEWAQRSGTTTRTHRGLRNVTAALDLASATWPDTKKLLLAGSSAGGFGVAANAPSVARFSFPVSTLLYVLNDSGPGISNTEQDIADILARADDWGFEQFYPASCEGCDILGQPGVALIDWRLDHDLGVREALYTTDGDSIIRFFLSVPTQEDYRDLLLGELGPVRDEHPRRFKRFIRSGSTAHTALGGSLFYTAEANGMPLYRWVGGLVWQNRGWYDLVEDFVPAP